MSNTVLVGLQWGDEGKGKIIDFLTETSDVVVRFQGGNNAGHTVEVGDEKFVLHLVPSGILRPEAVCVIGNGVVVNPVSLCEEIEGLRARGIDVEGRLEVSTRCQLIFEYHCLQDQVFEGKLGDSKIGTTKRGIGPAYADKVNRVGLRGALLCKPALLEERFRKQAAFYNAIFQEAGEPVMDIDAEWEKVRPAAEMLAPFVKDTVLTVNRAAKAGKEVLFEGAQGMWLDVDFGTYPFVTSSNTTSGAACTGGGLAPCRIDHVVGVAKAYTTRVGRGPFPTELDDETGEFLRSEGGEYGATTGRPRRCGWFDAVATRYSAMLNGVTGIAFTKMDVLDSFETIKVCTAYELDGKTITDMPSDNDDIERVKPIYEEVPGWQESTEGIRDYDDLPVRAKEYLTYLSDLLEAKPSIISVGPRRSQTFVLS
ncbi:MAG: adenylosuccinate synthase [Lentisphaerae bacterium]|jgi:adenylosuccinate synthase|nr:adenylosuccinate synthase [Lentisphaerota bacterium]MBT4817434.1 adenylosuccinate synthase [Lentisphaerota bacterium]MBT5611240.1 adenylosuccinate synthase [Lentisphaerota bacterium]MBT7057854.1 adenylosuccinate synthase [Lentisphaerota bacterium]MBT7841106.1 adenylosuccinate synthase [Lentisphaerota bacterium]